MIISRIDIDWETEGNRRNRFIFNENHILYFNLKKVFP